MFFFSLHLAHAGMSNPMFIDPMHFTEYSKSKYWQSPPKVVVCQSDFTLEEIQFAIETWSDEDPTIQVSGIEFREDCDYRFEDGTIKIVDGKLLRKGSWGRCLSKGDRIEVETEAGMVNQQVFTGVVMSLNRNITHLQLLIHEFGHAFGYQHFEGEVDVMNPAHDYRGFNSFKYPY